MEIVKENLITNAKAKDILKKRKKEVELGYEQKNTLDHLKKYDELTPKQADKLMEKLSEIDKLRERQIIAIINALPEDRDDLRLVLEKDYKYLEDEEKKLILSNVKEFI